MKPPTRRLFRHLLKPAIAVALLIVAPSVYVLWTRARFEDQYKAIEEIEDLGGTARLVPRTADPMCWFVRAEVYGDVWCMTVANSNEEITPDVMDRVCRVHTVQELAILGSVYAEGQIARLGKLQHLQRVSLCGTNVSDEDLAHLTGLQSLRVLSLDDTAITDKGLRHIARMSNLRYLKLSNTRVTDSGLPTLGKLARLHDLDLSATCAPGPGRAALQKMLPNLTINISRTQP
jgi:hypothetical protein